MNPPATAECRCTSPYSLDGRARQLHAAGHVILSMGSWMNECPGWCTSSNTTAPSVHMDISAFIECQVPGDRRMTSGTKHHLLIALATISNASLLSLLLASPIDRRSASIVASFLPRSYTQTRSIQRSCTGSSPSPRLPLKKESFASSRTASPGRTTTYRPVTATTTWRTLSPKTCQALTSQRATSQRVKSLRPSRLTFLHISRTLGHSPRATAPLLQRAPQARHTPTYPSRVSEVSTRAVQILEASREATARAVSRRVGYQHTEL